MRTLLTIAAMIALTGCEKTPGYFIASCRDDYSGQLFTFDSRQTFETVINLTGESYSHYRMADGRVIRVTNSWGDTHCRVIENHQV